MTDWEKMDALAAADLNEHELAAYNKFKGALMAKFFPAKIDYIKSALRGFLWVPGEKGL